MQLEDEYNQTAKRVPESLRRRLPYGLRRALNRLYRLYYDSRDFAAESIGWLPSRCLRLFLYRRLLKIRIGGDSSIHRGCGLYWPSSVHIGQHTVANRDVLPDGRMGLCWSRLHMHTGDPRHLEAGKRILACFVSTQCLGDLWPPSRGAIAGSWPVWRQYLRWRYSNWAVKFFLDALMLQPRLAAQADSTAREFWG